MSEAIAARLAARRRNWLPSKLHPGQMVVLSFVAVILLGTFLLSLPAASRSGQGMRVIDAFLTATSAACVTGLTVVDTGTHFTLLGQLVILGCIQVGGLGLMTFTTIFLLATGRRLAITDRIAIQDSFLHSPSGKMGPLVWYIIKATLVTEALGAVILAAWWLRTGVHENWLDALYAGIFHSISAFCNAGFALFPENVVRFQGDPVVLGILSTLIVAGGLGFLVGLDVKAYVEQKWFQSLWTEPRRELVATIRPRPRLSLHSKFVLTVSAVLLVVGTVSYYLLERNGLFREMGHAEALLNSWFCSVTARTAGFNSIDYAKMGGPALLCTMVLMFIGASPGSCGGGVKTSTFGILVTYAIFRWRGHESPHAFRRSIPQDSVDRATSVVIAGVAVVILASSFLMATEARSTVAEESQAKVLSLLFETFSGFGTVGLSMGITPKLTDAGKFVLSVLMFVGRVGPLTVAFAIGARSRGSRYKYAEENVMVG